MAHLIIFTNNFPFGNGETFLETEIFYLADYFTAIHIFPLYYGKSITARAIPANTSYSEPFFKIDVVTNRMGLLAAGLANNGPVRFAIKEGFNSKVISTFKHLKTYLSETFITRHLLSATNRKKIESVIKENSILYFYWGDKSSGIVPFLRKKYKNPIVARFHNSDLYEEIKKGYLPYRTELLKSLSSAVFIAENGEEYLKNRYNKVSFQSHVFRLGVNQVSGSTTKNDDVFRIVSCSYVVPIKRIDLIIDALNTLNFKIEWTHIGGGPLLEYIKEKSKTLKDNITPHFLGHVSNKEVLQFYMNNYIDLFLNVSASEGIPVSIMEAISAGIPVIATDVGGTSEVIDQSFGRLIDKKFSANYLGKLIFEFYSKSSNERLMMRKAAGSYWDTKFNANRNYTDFAMFLKNLEQH